MNSTVVRNTSADDFQERYDRQIRLWGEEGQNSIQGMSVCVFGSSTLATELLKSLVLAGIARFHVIDDCTVTWSDLGQNFFLDETCLGKSRAQCITQLLKELNPTVDGAYLHESVDKFTQEHIEELLKFSVVIGTNVANAQAEILSNFLFQHGVPFIYGRVFGLLGQMQLSFKEHIIWNDHNEENEPHDLRLDCPFEEIIKFAKETDLEEMEVSDDFRAHSHTPYLLIYFKILEEWKKQNNGNDFPVITRVRRDFERMLDDMRMPHPEGKGIVEANFDEAKANLFKGFKKTEIPESVRMVLSNSKIQSMDSAMADNKEQFVNSFWLLSSALKIFLEKHNGQLPLSGKLPDMTSDTERYTKLLSIYKEKAEQDALELFEIVNQLKNSKFQQRRGEIDEADENIEDEKCSDTVSNTSSTSSSGHGSGTAATGSPSGCAVPNSDGGDELSRMSVCSADAIESAPALDHLDELYVRGQKIVQCSPTLNQCRQFCRNSRRIGVLYGQQISNDSEKDLIKSLVETVFAENNDHSDQADCGPISLNVWFMLLKVAEKMRQETGIWPDSANPMDIEIFTRYINELIQNFSPPSQQQIAHRIAFPQAAVEEICRYAGAEPHVIAAILGGCMAQEAIKLCTHHYVPISGTFLYDGHTQTAAVFGNIN